MLISKKLIYFLISILLLFNEIACTRNNFLKLKSRKILNNLPSHKDLDLYLVSLKRIIDYAHENRDKLDLNFMFGLFLVNVNLNQFVEDESLPIDIQKSLNDLLTTNVNSLNFFMDEKYYNELNDVNFKISTFFKHSRLWSKRLNKLVLNLKQGKEFEIDQGDRSNLDWTTYVKNVDDIDKWEPSPKQSDYCMASLAENQNNNSSHTPICRFPENCYKMLRDGTNFGYGITHRLLFLLLARFGRGCAIFSASQDEAMAKSFCETILTESQYLAFNGFKHADLMFEQIALCTLNGHADFLRRAWLSNLLRYQAQSGCFGQDEANWRHGLLNGTCNGHVTAVAAGSFAAAIRFLLENY